MSDLSLDYVCPKCFNHVNKCSCSYKPYHLMQIDRNIQEHIRILNNKGYRTIGCCESHNQYGNMYIAFAFDYGFGEVLPMPKGFNKLKEGAVSFMYKRKTTDEEFKTQKKEHLENLLAWCNSLPIREND